MISAEHQRELDAIIKAVNQAIDKKLQDIDTQIIPDNNSASVHNKASLTAMHQKEIVLELNTFFDSFSKVLSDLVRQEGSIYSKVTVDVINDLSRSIKSKLESI